jgi:hypothetical protein
MSGTAQSFKLTYSLQQSYVVHIIITTIPFYGKKISGSKILGNIPKVTKTLYVV